MDTDLVQNMALALGLGLLVGFQREWRAPHTAGIRSFALIGPLGTLCAELGFTFGGWLPAAGLVSLAGVLVMGSLIKYRAGEAIPGITTNVTALLMYVTGAVLALDLKTTGIVMSGCMAVLLHWKESIHTFVKQLGEWEIRSIIQLVLFALVILPILPNKTYGPYDVFNPFHTWFSALAKVQTR